MGFWSGSYEVTAPTAVDAVWAISRSSRQITSKAFEPVSFPVRLGLRWPQCIVAVSFVEVQSYERRTRP